MIISPRSRYAEAPKFQVKTKDGSYQAACYALSTITAVPEYRYYVVTAGERMDQLAASLLGDPTLWWQIADLNPEYLYPEIPAGRTIRVPVPVT